MKTSIIQGEAQGESGGHQSPPAAGAVWRAAVPPSSELSDGEGVAARREGGIPAEAGKYTSSSSPAIGIKSIVGTLAVRSEWGIQVARRDRVHSATAAAASTAAASCSTRSRGKQMRRRSSEG